MNKGDLKETSNGLAIVEGFLKDGTPVLHLLTLEERCKRLLKQLPFSVGKEFKYIIKEYERRGRLLEERES